MYYFLCIYVFIVEDELRNCTKECKYGSTYWGWFYVSLLKWLNIISVYCFDKCSWNAYYVQIIK
jgi:hypothetical protein